MIYLLYSFALGKSLFESQWMTAESCKGPPTSMYEFQFNNPTAKTDKSVNETWPPFFGVWKTDVRVGYCGRMNAELKPYQCCVTSLNKTATGQASVAYEYVDVNNVINNMPTAVNNNPYCVITNDTVTNYDRLYILESQCAEFYRCQSSVLYLYTEKGCKGTNSSVPISDTPTTQLTPQGLLTISIKTFDTQRTKDTFIWRAQAPSSLLVIGFSELLDIVAILFNMMIVIAYGGAFFLTLRTYLRKMNWESFSDVIGRLLFFLYAIVDFLLTVAPKAFGTYSAFLKSFINPFFSLATLHCLLRSVYICLKLGNVAYWKTIVIYVCIIPVHAVLNISNYMYFEYAILKTGWVFSNINIAKAMFTYWNIFFISLNFVPLGVTIYLCIRKKTYSTWRLFKELMQKDLSFAGLLSFHVLNGLIYIGISQFRNYTRVSLGLDKSDIIIGIFQAYPIAIHIILQSVLLHYVVERIYYVGRTNSSKMSKSKESRGPRVSKAKTKRMESKSDLPDQAAKPIPN
ncbi:hypothetical protein BC833DRAFT_587393, partial [Globomyces pollinis-pini]